MEYVLKTNALCKTYRNFKALNGLTMNVPKGSIYGLVGKNGAPHDYEDVVADMQSCLDNMKSLAFNLKKENI